MADAIRYGLLRREDLGERNLSQVSAQARQEAHTSTQARLAAFEEQSLAHEADCAAYYIARGPFNFHGSISWTLRPDDPTRAATLTLHPLPSRSVEDLLKAGIISPEGVDEVALRRECERLRL